jgi:chromosome segregation ATPase
MQELIGLVGYLLALITTLSAWLMWQRLNRVQSNLDDSLRSRDEMVLATKDLRQECDSFRERLEKSQAELRKLKEQISREKNEGKAAVFEKTKLLADYEEAKTRAERRADNFEEQCESLLKQVRTAEALRSEAEKKYDELSKDFDRKVQGSRQAAETRNQQLRSDLHQLKSEYESLKQRATQLEELTKAASPEDVKRLKRKISNLEHLLMSMRGLKEMAEERSQNWEMALRILSTAALRQHERTAPSDQLGPLVGAALEAVGSSLVHDEWAVVPHGTHNAGGHKSESPIA